MKRKVKLFKAAGILFLLIFALLYSHVEVGMSGIESGRFATIQAVAEQGVFHIEKCNFRTVDRTVRNNHVYHDKLPFLPFVAGLAYKPFHRLCGVNFVDNYHLSIYLINFLTGAVVNIFLFLWLFDLLRSIKKGSLILKFALSLSCIAGSWIISYSTMLNNHTPAALAVLGVFVALMRYEKINSPRAALLAGFSAGVAGLLELLCGFFFGLAAVGGIFFAAPREKKISHTLLAAGAGLFCLAGGLLLNYYAYGTFLPLYMGSLGVKGTFSIGFQSDPVYYWYHALIGDRGILLYTPFLLCGLWACCRYWKKMYIAERSLLLSSAGFMLFYLTCTNEFGGQSYGLRYFIPIIPVLWYQGAKAVLEMEKRKFVIPLTAFLIIWGVATGLAGAYFPFSIGNEGERSPKGHFTRNFSSFGGNLLCWSYEYFPRSSLTANLLERYGLPDSVLYMYWSFFHRKRIDMLERMQHDFSDLYPGKKALNR